MNSEKRDRLLEVPMDSEPKRPASADRHLSLPPIALPSASAPDVRTPLENEDQEKSLPEPTLGGGPDSNIPEGARQVDYGLEAAEDIAPPLEPPPVDVEDAYSEHGSLRSGSDMDDIRLQEELEAKWILNLSMHFRDMSDREKFFITFAEEPNKWRRVTVSCDYRHLEPDSLEADLKTLHYQRDKSSRIYEAIRDSLPDIQFYDTVTNLKLETSDGRLHVHVTEDVNEIIPYPPVSAIDHLECKRFRENAVSFDSHISGFVYKVTVNNRTYIKKEIPGPDAVEEFLYEINALCSLEDSKSVIRFEGVIIDEQSELIKGLIISYAEQGALVDMIYDYKPTGQLYWGRRERWARQIVQGLSEIHEAGFVQGDFTLSNIVIDHNDDAKIIDINRRGCPVGWEPPELARLIESGQRISIYIGVKSDLFQLGMVLWALAEQQDEPERQERPLVRSLKRQDTDIPEYFKDIIRACLSDSPRDRPSATELFKRFPIPIEDDEHNARTAARASVSTHRSDKEYIDPATAVDLEDITEHRHHLRQRLSFENIETPPPEYQASNGSYVLPGKDDADRGRSPNPVRCNSRGRRNDFSPYPGHRSVMSFDDSELENELASLPASRETRWEQIYVDGDTKLVQRGCGEVDVHEFTAQEPKEICITTPPGEMETAFIANKTHDDTPLNLSAFADLQPIEPEMIVEPEITIELPRIEEPEPIIEPPHTIEPRLTIDTNFSTEPPPKVEIIEPYHSQDNLHEPQQTEHHRAIESKKSFSDRVHQLARSKSQPASPVKSHFNHGKHPPMPDSTTLTNLEHELASDSVPSSAAPSRAGTGFSGFSIFDRPDYTTRRVGTDFSIASGHYLPHHQDSGFSEPEKVEYDADRQRYSFDGSVRYVKPSISEERIDERLWDQKPSIMFDSGIGAQQLDIHLAQHHGIPIFTTPATPFNASVNPHFHSTKSSSQLPLPPTSTPHTATTTPLSSLRTPTKALEEKVSSTTIRPPSIFIPAFHCNVPRPLDSSHYPNGGSSVATPATDVSHDYSDEGYPPSHRDGDYTYKRSSFDKSRSSFDKRRSSYEVEDEDDVADDLTDYLSHSITFESLEGE